MHEEWRAIPGTNGYKASSFGRVRGPRCILKPSLLNSGYLGLKIAKRGTTAHAAVALAFIGPPPTDRHTVNHKNGVKTDNRPENLEWLTQADNNRHAIDVLGIVPGRPRKPRPVDNRTPFEIDLRSANWLHVEIKPRRGIQWAAVNAETGEVLHCAALKELLHWIADKLPRMLAARNLNDRRQATRGRARRDGAPVVTPPRSDAGAD